MPVPYKPVEEPQYHMSLTVALLKSPQGIARRREFVKRDRRGKEVYAWEFALASQKGRVFIVNGRTGVIRRMWTTDTLRNDWMPFQLERPKEFKIVVERKGIEPPAKEKK
jgi:hypothetical protein